MKSLHLAAGCVATVMALGATAFAQNGPPSGPTNPPSSNPPAAAQQAPDQGVTVSGCIQREADYRKAKDAGRGGVAGTGVGVGNEFMLINAGTGTSATGTATYELTGPNEGQASTHVGKRVEIVGKVKAAAVSSSGQPTGGATAGKPPAGVDVTSKDLQVRELEITSIKEVAGTCSAS